MPDTEKHKKNSGLKPWKPGESGNPAGRPPAGDLLAEMVRQIGEEADPKIKRTKKEEVVRKAWEQAARGDAKARDFLAERGWGKVAQAVTGPNGEELHIKVSYSE